MDAKTAPAIARAPSATVTYVNMNSNRPDFSAETQANPNELARKLKDLSLLNCPPKILRQYDPESNGTNGEESSVVANLASSNYSLPVPVISPSPRQDEKRRAELQHETVKDIAEHYRRILEDIGEDITRQGLEKTPERAAKALLYFTKGYDEKISGKLHAVDLPIYLFIYIIYVCVCECVCVMGCCCRN